MTDPLPGERYTWPTEPAGAVPPLEQRPVHQGARPRGGSARRQGVAAGTAFAILAVAGPLLYGIGVPRALGPAAVVVAASAVATAIPRVRSFAQGFLAGSVVTTVGAAVLLYGFVALVFVTATGL